MTNYAMQWNLESIFPGGSDSAAFEGFLRTIEEGLKKLSSEVGNSSGLTIELLNELQETSKQIREASAFTECLEAQDMNDKKAVRLSAAVRGYRARFESVLTYFDQLLLGIPQEEWEKLLGNEPFLSLAFPLNERREKAAEKLPPEQEALIQDLALDGYHGWGDAYNTAVGRLAVKVTIDGKEQSLSAGQAHNKLHDANRDVRIHVFDQWEKAWAGQSDLCSDALNRLAGFRLQVYKHRGWDGVLKEPLQYNRMSEETLQTMWGVIQNNKPTFVKYLERKAELFGLEKLSWHDESAPIGEASKTYAYDEAARIIIEQFRRFSPKMADFAKHVFEDGWIEAEDRAGKAPGGFCTSLPISKQTRIFMTYSGTADNVSTLAHELGHAYHQHVMDDLPELLQDYAMNVAETASTLAEMIVSEATLKQAETKEEKLFLLDDKLQRSIAFYMNIHARFLFETRFYEERQKGLVGVDTLNALMEEAQKEAFVGSLSDYHPHFWASKLHFYITDVPFYNFPYTFGYLFSAGLYAYAEKQGDSFEDRYIALLRDTGNMNVEDLARKHLGVDLTKPDFWQAALDFTARDVEQFLALSGK